MNETGWLIYSAEEAVRNKSYIDWMIQEANLIDMDLQFFYREDFTIGHCDAKLTVFHQGRSIELPAFAVIRTIDPFFTKQLELLGITCFNSAFVSDLCNNKAKTHQYMATHGIPMADTMYGSGNSFKSEAVRFDYPYIAKENSGRGGNKVFLINNTDEELALEGTPGTWITQKPATLGKDVRVFVIGKRIVAAVLRQSQTDFKSNYTLGGSASLYQLSEAERNLVEKIIKTIDFGLAGIDFVFSDDGDFLLNEIEDVVGSRSLSAVSDINIVREYLLHVKSEITH